MKTKGRRQSKNVEKASKVKESTPLAYRSRGKQALTYNIDGGIDVRPKWGLDTMERKTAKPKGGGQKIKGAGSPSQPKYVGRPR